MLLISKLRFLFAISLLIALAGCPSTVSEDTSASKANPPKATTTTTTTAEPKVIGFDPVVHFDFDKSVIKSSEAAVIEGQVAKIKTDNPTSILVEGHTDSIGTKEYNIALGERRANSTKNALVKSGVNRSLVEVVSYGKDRLLDTEETEEAHAKNRRTVTILNK